MTGEPTPTAQQLYDQGMAFFREAQWEEALRCFTRLQEISRAYPELPDLIADAQLKLEMTRIGVPSGVTPPRKPIPIVTIVAVTTLVLIAGVVAIVWLTPGTTASTTRPILVGSLPTRAPTLTPINTSTPLPTATATATATPTATASPMPTLVPEMGSLTVGTVDGKPLSRTTSNIALIVDASGSMLAPLGNRRRIDVARDAIVALIDKLPEDTNVALRSYGHRKSGDCSDVELIQPLTTLDRARLIAQVQGIKPKELGRTPIGLSLEQMTGDLRDAQGDTLIVLVSDGEETCDADPTAIAAKIHADNPRIRIAVVGFDLDVAEARASLNAIAESGGGSYFDATSAGQLTEALQQAITLSYRVLDASGKEVYSGQLGSSANLPAGSYTVEIGGSDALQVDSVTVKGNAATTVHVREKNGALSAEIAGQ